MNPPTSTAGHDPPKTDTAPLAGRAGTNRSPTPNHSTAEADIKSFLMAMYAPGDVFEVRALNCADRPGSTFTSTISGYYQHNQIELASKHIAALDASGRAPVIYATLNPVQPALLARALNRLKSKARETTTDADVVRRRRLLIDLDPVRPAGVSSTDSELALAVERCLAVKQHLASEGWPEPIEGLSGNGAHLIYAVDLPADDAGVVGGVLTALAAAFDDEKVKVDRSVHNPARVTKVLGTTAANKGDSMVGVAGQEDRPHRRSRLLRVPDVILPVPREALEEVAGAAASTDPVGDLLPGAGIAPRPRADGRFARFEHSASGVRAYLEARGVTIKSEERDGATALLHLEGCPVVADCQSTGASDISVLVGDDGKIVYKNLHSRGSGLTWLDVRETLEPGYKKWVGARGWESRPGAGEGSAGHAGVAPFAWSPPQPLWIGVEPAQFPLSKAFPPALDRIRDFVAALAEALQVPVDLPAMLLLPMAGGCLAHKFEIEPRPGWREVGALYVLSLLESGERKSVTFARMLEPILAWERAQAENLGATIAESQEERRIKEGMQTELRRKAARGDADAKEEAVRLARELAGETVLSVPILYCSEATSEGLALQLLQNQERALVASPEADAFDVMMGRYSERGQPNLGIWLKGHSGDAERVVRRGRPPEFLRRPVINVGLTVQPEAVRGMFASPAARGRGMLARILVSSPRSQVGHRKTGGAAEPLPDWLYDAYATPLQCLLDAPIPEHPEIVRLDPEATELFNEFEARVEPELARGGCLGDRKDWGSKLCGAVARIALVLFALQWARTRRSERTASSARLIDGATMRAALAWAPYLIEHERSTTAIVGCDAVSATADRILGWVERRGFGSFSRREAFIAVRSGQVQTVDEVDEPLSLLVELGYLRPEPVRAQGPAGGRPASPRFAVNPLFKGKNQP